MAQMLGCRDSRCLLVVFLCKVLSSASQFTLESITYIANELSNTVSLAVYH